MIESEASGDNDFESTFTNEPANKVWPGELVVLMLGNTALLTNPRNADKDLTEVIRSNHAA
jgi:hypothetical protein